MSFEPSFRVTVIQDQNDVVVIASPNVAPSKITEALKEVSAKFPGSSVVEAAVGAYPIGGNPKAGYVDGIVGRLKFKTTQSAEELKRAQKATKDALIAQHIGIDSDD